MIARSLLSPFDLHLFNEGTHSHLFDKLGAHLSTEPDGTSFAVWAPNADAVSVKSGGESYVCAVRPSFSFPAPEWVAADPSFWQAS